MTVSYLVNMPPTARHRYSPGHGPLIGQDGAERPRGRPAIRATLGTAVGGAATKASDRRKLKDKRDGKEPGRNQAVIRVYGAFIPTRTAPIMTLISANKDYHDYHDQPVRELTGKEETKRPPRN